MGTDRWQHGFVVFVVTRDVFESLLFLFCDELMLGHNPHHLFDATFCLARVLQQHVLLTESIHNKNMSVINT